MASPRIIGPPFVFIVVPASCNRIRSKIVSINWLFGGLALIENERNLFSDWSGAILIFIPNLPRAARLRD